MSVHRSEDPSLRKSRERTALCETLTSELAVVYKRTQRYCTAQQLKQDYPGFKLWSLITDHELKQLMSGDQFRIKAFAKQLTLRAYGLKSLAALKIDRRNVRQADNAAG